MLTIFTTLISIIKLTGKGTDFREAYFCEKLRYLHCLHYKTSNRLYIYICISTIYIYVYMCHCASHCIYIYIFTVKHLYQSLFLDKISTWNPATFWKQRLRHRCCSVDFAKIVILWKHLATTASENQSNKD